MRRRSATLAQIAENLDVSPCAFGDLGAALLSDTPVEQPT
jgi:hypothetical protein